MSAELEIIIKRMAIVVQYTYIKESTARIVVPHYRKVLIINVLMRNALIK